MRARKSRETRSRIAEAAIRLFVGQGYAQTTIDQIAEAADVSRRTVFHHFPTKSSMLLDHLVGRREEVIALLRERPPTEPALASLHTVLRGLCERGHDRGLLAQIRTVLATEPHFAAENLVPVSRSFVQEITEVLQSRAGTPPPSLEAQALTRMALDWVVTAVQHYLCEGTQSLVAYFDDVVAACARATLHDLP